MSLIQVDDPSYDLLCGIKCLWDFSKIQWKIQYVAGHQDDNKAISDLDRREVLNIEMDAAAKSHMTTALQSPQHFCVLHEPWSIWLGTAKVIWHLSSTLYNIVHSVEAKQYWMAKRNISGEDWDLINWPVLDKGIRLHTGH